MNLNEALQGHPEMFFVESLSPVEEAYKMGDRPGRFHYQEVANYLQQSSFTTRDFYYNHYNPLAPFCYFQDYIIIDFPRFTEETLRKYGVLASIQLAEERLGAAIRSRDFPTFFAMIDPRLALQAFVKQFHAIPVEQRYTIFWHLYSRCDWRLDTFPSRLIDDLIQYRRRPLPLRPEADGYLEVFHGTMHGSQSVKEAYSWTLDINSAIYNTARTNKQGQIFRARVPLSQVLAYLPWKKEQEIIIYPGLIKDFEEVPFRSLLSYVEEMKDNGLWFLYKTYADRLIPELFYKPMGIHGLLHTRNVLFMVLLLAFLQGSDQQDIALLGQIALYHDIGRSNDNFDPEHGKESYLKVEELSLLNLGDVDQDIARFIIENHCIDDQKAHKALPRYVSHDQKRALQLFNTFKDADGLDRVRIMDLDVKQLRSSKAKDLLLAARQLLDTAVLE